jgi:hypothetical protein
MDVLDKNAENSLRQLVDIAIREGIESLSHDLKIMDGDAVRAGAFGSGQHQVAILERYRQELTSQSRTAWSHTEELLSEHGTNADNLKAVMFELITPIRDTLPNSLNSSPQVEKNSPFGTRVIDIETPLDETFCHVISEINAKIDLYPAKQHKAKNRFRSGNSLP